jgi:hypothetical protein
MLTDDAWKSKLTLREIDRWIARIARTTEDALSDPDPDNPLYRELMEALRVADEAARRLRELAVKAGRHG